MAKKIPEPVRRVVWVRCGGRCFLCGEDLLDGDVGVVQPLDELAGSAVGDLAHLVGRSDDPRSRRSSSDPDLEDRDSADNLVLACPSHHRQADTAAGELVFDLDTLRRLKANHERAIRFATSLASQDRSTILRVIGQIDGGRVSATPNDCANAVLHHERRLPGWAQDFDRSGIEINLGALPGYGTAAYYETGRQAIDERLRDVWRDVAAGRIERLSVFAAARLPLLVYLGHALDDGIPVTVYQRDKLNKTWRWPGDGSHLQFNMLIPDSHPGGEALLVVALTADPDIHLLPKPVQALPTWMLQANPCGDDVIDGPQALESFEAAIRRVFTDMDSKNVSRIHLVAAVPVAAAVTIGQILPASHHPPVHVYERSAASYNEALVITT